MTSRYRAPYMEWAKSRTPAKYDLAGSNVLACTIDDLPGAREALDLSGRNDDGYQPLVESIAARYGVEASSVATAVGTSGANFLVCAALLEPGDEVLVERPGYDPLLGAPRVFGAAIARFDRPFDDKFAVDPDRVRRAVTPRTRLIVVTRPHNPSGVAPGDDVMKEIGRIAAAAGAHVLVDEVYLDAAAEATPSVRLGEEFITTSSLTKSYGLAALRCGWALAAPEVAERIRRARDVVDGTGSIAAERLGVLAFAQLDRLLARARQIVDANRAAFEAVLGSRPELECVTPARSTVLFPRLRDVDDAALFINRLLHERETGVVPGRFFDAPAHFRVGLGGAAEPTRRGVAAIAAALAEQAW